LRKIALMLRGIRNLRQSADSESTNFPTCRRVERGMASRLAESSWALGNTCQGSTSRKSLFERTK
jgi:hypothetical protein